MEKCLKPELLEDMTEQFIKWYSEHPDGKLEIEKWYKKQGTGYKKYAVKGFFNSFGQFTFYCPMCGQWHYHSEVEDDDGYGEYKTKFGHRVPHCNYWRNQYEIQLFSFKELLEMRDLINITLNNVRYKNLLADCDNE
jgi:hypothetical protein